MSRSLRILLAKEWRELRRDRRVLLVSLVLPVLLYPALLGGVQRLQSRHAGQLESSRIEVASPLESGPLFESLLADSSLTLRPTDPDSLGLAVSSRRAAVAIDADSVLDTVRIYVATTREESREAERRLRGILDELRGDLLARRLLEESRPDGALDVVSLRSASIATAAEESGSEASRLVIYLLLMILYMAGSVLATDMVAGEKERGTLETLFLAPVDRATIARAKVIVVATGTALTGLLCLIGLGASYALGWVRADDGGLIVLPAHALIGISVVTVPAAALIGTILLGISTWARTLKEAQTTMLPVMLLLLVPGLLSMQQSIEMSALVAVIPVANLAFLMRDLLTGTVQWGWWALSLAATLAYLGLALRTVVGMLGREELVLGFDHESLLARSAGGTRRAAHLSLALSLLLYFYVGQWLQSRWEIRGLVISLWVVLPAFVLAGLALTRLLKAAGETLSLRAPRPTALLGAVLLGAGAILPLVGGLQALQNRIMPMPTIDSALATQLDRLGLPLAILLLALSPAIVEELLFRGFAMGALRRGGVGARAAVAWSALYFAAMHLSAHRFLLTFVLGCLLGFTAHRARSVFASMTLHLVYNGSLVWGVEYFSRHEFPLDPRGGIAWTLSAVALAAGAWLLARLPDPLRTGRTGVS